MDLLKQLCLNKNIGWFFLHIGTKSLTLSGWEKVLISGLIRKVGSCEKRNISINAEIGFAEKLHRGGHIFGIVVFALLEL